MTDWLVLPVVLAVGLSSTVVAAPLATAGSPATGADTAQPRTDAIDAAHPITSWVAIGFGTAGIGGQDGDGVRLEFALAAGMHLLSLRYVFAADTNDISLPHNSVSEIALQYGVKKRIPYLVGTASAGVAAIWTVQRGDTFLSSCAFCPDQYNSINGHAVGATAEIGGYLTSRYVSVGPTFVMDVNSIQSFWSLLFDLHFGWMGDGGVFRGRQSP